jgi:hypothetical protein
LPSDNADRAQSRASRAAGGFGCNPLAKIIREAVVASYCATQIRSLEATALRFSTILENDKIAVDLRNTVDSGAVASSRRVFSMRYARDLRLRTNVKPAMPEPKRNSVAGSGTAGVTPGPPTVISPLIKRPARALAGC